MLIRLTRKEALWCFSWPLLTSQTDLIDWSARGREAVKKLVHSFPGATVTKYHKLNGLNNGSLFSHSEGGSKSKTQVFAGWVPFEGAERESVLCPSPSFG